MADLLTPIELVFPGRVHFGPGTAATIGDFARERQFAKTFVVADAFNATRIGALHLPGEVAIFAEVTREPDIPMLEAALGAARGSGAEFVVGFGGGSAMDLAKIVAALLEDARGVTEIAGPGKARPRRVGLAMVATTAGTGSEAGMRALVTDPVTEAKLAVQSRHIVADIAAVDADLMLSVPARITAETGVDALAHCAEGYTSKRAHPLVDTFALAGIRLIGQYLPRAIADGGDREARAALALAAFWGGICLGPVNTHAGHAVAYPLGTRHHVSHGAANAVIFPHVLAFNAPTVPGRTADILSALGLEPSQDPETVRERAYGWCRGLGIEMRMSARGIPEGDLDAMAKDAAGIRRLLDNNPRDIGEADILKIYRDAW